jgi:hypothetical protein
MPDTETLESMHRMLDRLYAARKTVPRSQIIGYAEIFDLPERVLGIVRSLPPGSYTRQRLVDQLNSAICGHGLGSVVGTLE